MKVRCRPSCTESGQVPWYRHLEIRSRAESRHFRQKVAFTRRTALTGPHATVAQDGFTSRRIDLLALCEVLTDRDIRDQR